MVNVTIHSTQVHVYTFIIQLSWIQGVLKALETLNSTLLVSLAVNDQLADPFQHGNGVKFYRRCEIRQASELSLHLGSAVVRKYHGSCSLEQVFELNLGLGVGFLFAFPPVEVYFVVTLVISPSTLSFGSLGFWGGRFLTAAMEAFTAGEYEYNSWVRILVTICDNVSSNVWNWALFCPSGWKRCFRLLALLLVEVAFDLHLPPLPFRRPLPPLV